MKYKYRCFLLFFFGILLFPKQSPAQETEIPTDDLGNVSDTFQEKFFEALKQKGIENYELALDALKHAEIAAEGNKQQQAVVYFEMGKNLTSLKRYDEAELNFKKVLASQGNRLDVMEALYNLYYLEQDYEAAIPLVQKLIEFDSYYKEDLANLYVRTEAYDKALQVLDELDILWGESEYRDALRSQIYRKTGNVSGAIEKLEAKIDTNPKSERDYLNLIFLYSEEGDTEKAYSTARELVKQHPNSELVHLALYKFYLDEGNITEAISSMKKVFASRQADTESKYRVLGDFIAFVNENSQYETELESVVAGFSEDNGKVYEDVGNYYLSKGRKSEALAFYEKGIRNDEDNFSLLKNTLLLQIEFKKYEPAEALSLKGIEIFPAQPLLYLINGVANINLQNANAAIESLETGVDFLLDDPAMEKDFYEQLQIAYTLKGDTKNAAAYAKKASEIKMPN